MARRAGHLGSGRRADRAAARRGRPGNLHPGKQRRAAADSAPLVRCAATGLVGQAEAYRERIGSTVSGLLALLGIAVDPISSREHILLANVLDHSWRRATTWTWRGLIHAVQSPPFQKVGVLDLETFFPAKERFALAMKLNNLLASPGFAAWMEGEPLDVGGLLYTPRGKAAAVDHVDRASVRQRADVLRHDPPERGAGLDSDPAGHIEPAAILYMDEIYGYFPPTANPPSKVPMLTLLKQARAFGLGVVLATQNPVDLDYKGLSNAGTWFLGRLQTQRDKDRVLEGLEGASTAAGHAFDRKKMDEILSGLGNRVFVMNNVHDDQPVVFQTRWALSYLRGPLTREQIQSPDGGSQAGHPGRPRRPGSHGRPRPSSRPPSSTPTPTSVSGGDRPVVPPDVPAFFVPRRGSLKPGESLLYRPAILGVARLHYADKKAGIDHWETLALVERVDDEMPAELWSESEPFDDGVPELDKAPRPAPRAAGRATRRHPTG